MTTSTINLTAAAKLSDAAEWALCSRYGIERTKHDSSAYDRDSDVNAGAIRISVKTSGFTLMAGSLCEGRDTFDGIWNLYADRVHSNHFAYVTADGTCYMMSLGEFKNLYMRSAASKEKAKRTAGQ